MNANVCVCERVLTKPIVIRLVTCFVSCSYRFLLDDGDTFLRHRQWCRYVSIIKPQSSPETQTTATVFLPVHLLT